MIDWNIQARSHVCQGCHKHFVDKETFHTTLRDERHGLERRDLCEACWRLEAVQLDLNGSNNSLLSQWQVVYITPPASPPDAIQKDTAESLLRKLVMQNDPIHEGARFVLAVMLERKRLLKSKGQVKEGDRRVLIYEQAKTGDVFMIVDPCLQLNQLESVQRDILQLLEHGLEGAAESVPPTAPELVVVSSNLEPLPEPSTTSSST